MQVDDAQDSKLAKFLDDHRLPDQYRNTTHRWFIPLAERIKSQTAHHQRPFIVGINGSQGSGKSTLSELLLTLLKQLDLKAITLSIDDFYHTAAERHHLADTIHPLLATRGVPGTHDTHLFNQTLDNLKQDQGTVKLPRFNKAEDDRYPSDKWPEISLPIDVIILEGWCLGTPPQTDTDLQTPINQFERDEDHTGLWRRHVNERLKDDYQPLFARIDYWIMLKAPDFNCVYRWRQEQEDKLKARNSGSKVMPPAQLQRFIQHYERLTRHTLKTLPHMADEVFELDTERNIIHHRMHQAD